MINSSNDFSVFGKKKKKVDLATYSTYFPGIYFILIYLPTYLLHQSRLKKTNLSPSNCSEVSSLSCHLNFRRFAASRLEVDSGNRVSIVQAVNIGWFYHDGLGGQLFVFWIMFVIMWMKKQDKIYVYTNI